MAAYVVAEVFITDAEQYEKYKPLASASIAAHGGTYKARGGTTHSLEGDAVEGRVIVLEFPDLEQARGWYESREYQEAKQLREGASRSRAFIVEGHDPG
jgi:uncharacterized protein (DUF1330 family)